MSVQKTYTSRTRKGLSKLMFLVSRGVRSPAISHTLEEHNGLARPQNSNPVTTTHSLFPSRRASMRTLGCREMWFILTYKKHAKSSSQPFEKFILQIVREICRFVQNCLSPCYRNLGKGHQNLKKNEEKTFLSNIGRSIRRSEYVGS